MAKSFVQSQGYRLLALVTCRSIIYWNTSIWHRSI